MKVELEVKSEVEVRGGGHHRIGLGYAIDSFFSYCFNCVLSVD